MEEGVPVPSDDNMMRPLLNLQLYETGTITSSSRLSLQSPRVRSPPTGGSAKVEETLGETPNITYNLLQAQ